MQPRGLLATSLPFTRRLLPRRFLVAAPDYRLTVTTAPTIVAPGVSGDPLLEEIAGGPIVYMERRGDLAEPVEGYQPLDGRVYRVQPLGTVDVEGLAALAAAWTGGDASLAAELVEEAAGEAGVPVRAAKAGKGRSLLIYVAGEPTLERLVIEPAVSQELTVTVPLRPRRGGGWLLAAPALRLGDRVPVAGPGFRVVVRYTQEDAEGSGFPAFVETLSRLAARRLGSLLAPARRLVWAPSYYTVRGRGVWWIPAVEDRHRLEAEVVAADAPGPGRLRGERLDAAGRPVLVRVSQSTLGIGAPELGSYTLPVLPVWGSVDELEERVEEVLEALLAAGVGRGGTMNVTYGSAGLFAVPGRPGVVHAVRAAGRLPYVELPASQVSVSTERESEFRELLRRVNRLVSILTAAEE